MHFYTLQKKNKHFLVRYVDLVEFYLKKTHGEKTFSVEVCGLAFSQSSHSKRHMQKHIREKAHS